MNALVKLIVFYESYNKTMRTFLGNGCRKWERLWERLRKNISFFSSFYCRICLPLHREKTESSVFFIAEWKTTQSVAIRPKITIKLKRILSNLRKK